MKLRGAASLLVAALCCACSYTATTSLAYRPIPIETRPPVQPHLVVKPLTDARPPGLYSNQFGSSFKTYIPLIPYVRIPYERLDETSQKHEKERMASGKPLERSTQPFTQGIALAIADDLRSSGLFSEVVMLSEAGAPVDGAYVLSGELRSTELDVNRTSYMLGAVGVLLWILPIPLGSTTAEVEADLNLSDPSGKTVWQDRLAGRGRRVYTMYNDYGEPVSSSFRLQIKRYGSNDEGIDGDSLWAYHASAIRAGMVRVKQSLAAMLGSAP